MNSPIFTIITSTYNAAATLPRLLDSLASQTCRDFNWIVQDGASSDATMHIVEQYRDRLPEILADSSRDNGIYDAWNKAIDRWQNKMGEWVLFLGADDRLVDACVLKRVQEKISRADANTLFAAGDIIIYDISTEKIIKKLESKPGCFTQRFRGLPIPHTGLFTHRSLLSPFCFDAHFRIAGDYEFILRNWKTENQLLLLNTCITQMGSTGISNTNSTLREDFTAIKTISLYNAFRYLFIKFIENTKLQIKILLLKIPSGQNIYKIYRKLRKFD